jgi:RHS repeat-associated protein
MRGKRHHREHVRAQGIRHHRLFRLTALAVIVLLSLGVWAPAASATPLVWPSVSLSGLVGLLTGHTAPDPRVPHERTGRASRTRTVPARVTKTKGRTEGNRPHAGRGQLPQYRAHGPAGAMHKTGSGVVMGEQYFNAKTSRLVGSAMTANSDLYKNANGTYTKKLFAGPVNYQTAAGTWVPIDTSLVPAAGGRLAEKANSIGQSLAVVANTPRLIESALPGGTSVSLGLAGAAAVPGVVSGSSVNYPDVLAQTSLEAQGVNSALTETLLLKSPDAASTWVFPLKLTGLTAVMAPDGGIDLINSSGQVAGEIAHGYAEDSSFNRRSAEPAQTDAVSYQLVSYQGGPAIQMTLDPAWLDATARVFPVKVTGFGDVAAAPAGTPAPGGSPAAVSARSMSERAAAEAVSCTTNGSSYCAEPDKGGTYAMYPFTNNYSTDTVLKIGNDGSGDYAESYLQFNQIGSALPDAQITAASLNLFDIWAYYCGAAEPFSVYRISESWTVNATYDWSDRPTTGADAFGTYDAAAPSSACSNTSLNPKTGGWMSTSLSTWIFNDWTLGDTSSWPEDGFAVATGTAASDDYEWKQFDSDNASANIPYIELTYAADQAPGFTISSPQDNYNATTLTPELIADGTDPDSWPDTLGYWFAIFNSSGLVANSAGSTSKTPPSCSQSDNETDNTTNWQASPNWTVPAGTSDLQWGQVYYWYAVDCDGLETGSTAAAYLTTQVPQPTITSASQNSGEQGISPGSNAYTTSVTDAQISTVGPALEIQRDYDSLDPVTSGAFGTGWSSVLDMQVSPGFTDSSGDVLTANVTYPDGEQVGFGANYPFSAGTFTAPEGRYATLSAAMNTSSPPAATGYTLIDKNDTTYDFDESLGGGVFGISKIVDALGNSLVFTWNSASPPQITSMGSVPAGQSSPTRSLAIAWTAGSSGVSPHVLTAVTNDVTAGNSGTALTWTYLYSGNQLTGVCDPEVSTPCTGSPTACPSGTGCTSYTYANGTVFPDAVLDTGPQSYWRLDDASGSTKAASAVLANEGTDDGTYSNVTLGSGASLADSTATTASFNGTSSYVTLPGSLLLDRTYQSVGMWFKTSTAGGILLSETEDPISDSTSSWYAPSLYIGTDGELHAEFYNGGATTITDTTKLDNGAWHYVVLTSAGNTQTLYVDGSQIGSALSGTIDDQHMLYDYVGAGFTGNGWPDESNSGNASVRQYFNGQISDVAAWDRPLTNTEVAGLYQAGSTAAGQLSEVTRPSGPSDVYAQVAYSTVSGAVSQVTDDNGGVWGVGTPTSSGSSQVYVSSILAQDPQDYWRLNDASGTAATNQLPGASGTYSNVTLGASGPFSDTTAATFSSASSSYVQMPGIPISSSGAQTVSLWFKTSTSGNDPLLGDGDTDVAEPVLNLSGGVLSGSFPDGTAQLDIGCSITGLDNNKWHNVVLMTSGTTGSQDLFVDGQFCGSTAQGSPGSTEASYFLGMAAVGDVIGNSNFSGSLSDFAWYPEKLTGTQVQEEWAAAQNSGGLTPVVSETITHYSDANHDNPATMTYQMDPLNGYRIVSQTDPMGRVTRFGYDTGGFQSTVQDPDGNLTMTGYDPRGNVVSETACQNFAAQNCSTGYYTYYPNDTSTTLTPDPRNDLMLTARGPGSSSATDNTYLTTYTYNAQGELTSETGPAVPGYPAGLTTTYTYSTSASPAYSLTTGQALGTTPAGLLLTETSAGGAETWYEYDSAGDVYQVTDPDLMATTYGYDGIGRETAKTEYVCPVEGVQAGSSACPSPQELTTTYQYDQMGDVTLETDPEVTDTAGSAHTAQITTTYDADGDMKTQSVADLTGGDTAREVQYGYNDHDQLVSSIDADNNKTTYSYDSYGNLASETDPGGNTIDYAYDGDNDLVGQTLTGYTGSTSGLSCQTVSGSLVESSRSYDPAGQLASITDADCFTTLYTYTGNGLVSTITRCSDWTGTACTGTSYVEEANTYNAANQLTQQVTDNGQTTTTYSPDAEGQNTSATLDPAGLDRTTSYVYSPDNAVLSQTVTGSGSSAPAQETDYSYDPMGNMTSQSVHDDPASVASPAGWWPLTNSGGANENYVPDASGNDNMLTPGTGVSWSTSGAAFGGTSGQQLSANSSVADTADSFSVSAWVNLAGDTSSYQGIMSDHSAEEDGFRLQYNAGNDTWSFDRSTTDTATADLVTADSAATAATGTWTFLTGTFNASTGALTLYVNGAQNGSTATDTTPYAATGPLVIGDDQYEGGVGDFLDGTVADAQVYPYALSSSQVSTLFGEGRSGSLDATKWTLDNRGLPTSMTDPDGNTTSYTYDQAGQLTQVAGPAVPVQTFASQTPVMTAPVTSYGYDTFGDNVITEDPNGNETFTAYDGNGQPTSVTGPSYTPPDGTGTITPQTQTTYNDLGEVQSQTDALGNTTTYNYDQLGDVTSVTAPNTGMTAYTYDADGNQTSVTSPDGTETQTTNDFLGRPLTSTLTNSASGSAADTTSYAYGTGDTSPWQTSQTTQDGVTTTYGHDAAGEITSVTDGAGDVTKYQYSPTGQLTETTNPDGTYTTATYDEAGNAIGTADYSAAGVLQRSESAGYDPDGNQTSVTDYRGNESTYAYDAAGQLTSEVQPVTSSTSVTTRFGYDAAGNPTLYTDGNGSNWWTTYNTLNLPGSQIEPPTSSAPTTADGTFTMSYDKDGDPVEEQEPGGITVSSQYNNMGELTQESGSGAGAATGTRTFGYNNDGLMTSAATPSGSDTFSYNPLDELSGATGQSGTSSFSYNGDGLLSSVTDAAGTTSYSYDSADRLHTLADPLTGTTLTYSYNPDSQVSQISYGSGGDSQTFGYNNVHELTSQALDNASGGQIASVAYTYDNNGNMLTKDTTGLNGSASNTYAYNEANELTSWNNGTATTNYGYDNDGNRTQVGSTTYSYDARDELTSDGTNSYSYTMAGTLASVSGPSGTTNYTSDAFGQAITQGSQTYAYDALGRVVSDGGSAGTAKFSYDGTSTTIASDGSSNYTWDPSGTSLVAEGPVGGTTANGVLALTDAHTDVIGQFTASGTALTGSTTYDPFGNVLATTGMVGNLGYQSAWTDTANGRVDMNARWYDPAVGQFTSRDTTTVNPVPDSAAANPFAYAADNPMTGTDPTGHMFMMMDGGGGGAPTSSGGGGGGGGYRPSPPPPPPPSCSGFFGCLVSDVSGAVHDVAHAVVHVYHAVVHTVSTAINDVENSAADVMEDIHAAMADARAIAGHIAHDISTAVDDGVHHAEHVIGDAWHAAAAATSTVAHAVTHYAVEAYHATVTVVKTAVHAVAKAATATVQFVKHHAAAIAAFVASTAVFVGCDAALGIATAGVGAVAGAAACGALAGAVGNAVSYGVTAAQTGKFSWSSLGGSMLEGAATGLIGGALGGAAAEGLSGLGDVASGLISSGAADDAATEATEAAASGTAADQAAAVSSQAEAATTDATATEPAGTAAEGSLVNLSTAGRTADEAAAINEYAARSNEWLARNGPQTIQPTDGALRAEASAAARAERLAAERAGNPYLGQAGHVPDTAITGQANPPGGWLDMPGVSNQVCGGVLGSRVGQLISGFTVDGGPAC